ncbi:hypothetical protein [Streptomyces sp. NPDC058623]|uniref:hypothetical protein n=1 Tax=Streptomyces sp. NPDC058623 TaxID=3346563 RepID=UPI00365B2EF4
MSDSSIPPSAQPEPSGKPGPTVPSAPEDGAPAAGSRGRAAVGRLVPRGNGARWAAVGIAVVVVGGGVAALAAAEHHHDRQDGPRLIRTAPGPGGPGEYRAEGAPGRGHRAGPEEHGEFDGPAGPGGRGDAARAAPAPLPSLAIGDAAAKAAAAVTGGKVESLRVVAQRGGGSAWLAVVLGPDGVRHSVTVSGTDGAITGNTPVDR